MKQFLLAMGIACASFLAHAQITLTLSNTSIPNAMTVTYHLADSVDTTFDVGPSGANVTWDFSNLTSSSSMTSTVTATGGGYYTSANGTGTEGYMHYDNTGFGMVGADFGASGSMDLTDRQDYVQYPFTYQSSFTDPFSGTIDMVVQTQNRQGTITATGDGYGTLILPDGTINDVLRIKQTLEYTDEYMGITTMESEEVRYHWYSETSRAAVAAFSILTSQVPGLPANVTVIMSYMEAGAVGVEDELRAEAQLSAPFPNPASQSFMVRVGSDVKIENIELIDIQGRSVQSDYRIADGVLSMDVSSLSKGYYTLRVQAGSGDYFRSIIVN